MPLLCTVKSYQGNVAHGQVSKTGQIYTVQQKDLGEKCVVFAEDYGQKS